MSGANELLDSLTDKDISVYTAKQGVRKERAKDFTGAVKEVWTITGKSDGSEVAELTVELKLRYFASSYDVPPMYGYDTYESFPYQARMLPTGFLTSDALEVTFISSSDGCTVTPYCVLDNQYNCISFYGPHMVQSVNQPSEGDELTVTYKVKITAEKSRYDGSYEEHIVIGPDRSITVPKSLKRIAVQFDHNMETVTFDCPRYWDGIDMSKMSVYINYKLPNGYCGAYVANNVIVDDIDDNIMHFDWTITNAVTQYKGNVAFLVCIRKADEDGNEENHWNTELNTEMYISEGLECKEADLYVNPDVISHILQEMQDVDRKIKDAVSTLVVDGTSLAIGDRATVSGDGCLAISHGESAEAKNGGVAIGDYVKADGLGSLAIGYHSQAKSAFSVALGIGAEADASNPNPSYGSIMAFCYKPQNGDPFWIDDKGIPHTRASKGYSGDVYDEAMHTDSLVTKLSLQKAIQSLNDAIQSEIQNINSETQDINSEIQSLNNTIQSEIQNINNVIQSIRTETPKVNKDVATDGTSSVDIYPNIFTVLNDSNEREPGPIKLNLINPTNNDIVNEYKIRITAAMTFGNEDSKAFECVGVTVKGLPAEIVAGMTYEISIIDGFATYATWE